MKGITLEWDNDCRGNSVLLVRKSRGRLTLDEITEALRYEKHGQYCGRYAIMVNASENTCGTGWMDEIEPKGDVVELYQVAGEDDCPVCGKLTPPFEYCPHCGEPWKEEPK